MILHMAGAILETHIQQPVQINAKQNALKLQDALGGGGKVNGFSAILWITLHGVFRILTLCPETVHVSIKGSVQSRNFIDIISRLSLPELFRSFSGAFAGAC